MRTSPLRWIAAAATALVLSVSAAAQRGQIVQSGQVFTGVIQGNRTFQFPIDIAGYTGEQELLAVEVTVDARMSGEYTIQPTAVPPNGIVAAHSTTTLSLGPDALGKIDIDFAPLPWVFPVNFPLNILWALDARDREVVRDAPGLSLFETNGSVSLLATVDITTLVMPKNWANPHLAGVFATWTVRYRFGPPASDTGEPIPAPRGGDIGERGARHAGS